MPGDGVLPVVALGQVGVVAVTHQGNIVHAMVAAETEGVAMVELEPAARRAPSALFIHVAASVAVAFMYRPPDGRRDVA
jgi:hypothetical protein